MNYKLILKKNIPKLLYTIDDQEIMKIFFDIIKSERPKRCTLVDDKKIKIRNYFLDDADTKNWHKSNYIMLGTNKWNLILEGTISIFTNTQTKTRTILYSLNLSLMIITTIAITTIFGSIITYGLYKGSGSLLYGLQIGGVSILIWSILNLVNFLFWKKQHQKILNDGIEKLKTILPKT